CPKTPLGFVAVENVQELLLPQRIVSHAIHQGRPPPFVNPWDCKEWNSGLGDHTQNAVTGQGQDVSQRLTICMKPPIIGLHFRRRSLQLWTDNPRPTPFNV